MDVSYNVYVMMYVVAVCDIQCSRYGFVFVPWR